MLWPFFELVDPLYGFLIEYITTNPINGIGWITDDPAPSQMINDLTYQP